MKKRPPMHKTLIIVPIPREIHEISKNCYTSCYMKEHEYYELLIQVMWKNHYYNLSVKDTIYGWLINNDPWTFTIERDSITNLYITLITAIKTIKSNIPNLLNTLFRITSMEDIEIRYKQCKLEVLA